MFRRCQRRIFQKRFSPLIAFFYLFSLLGNKVTNSLEEFFLWSRHAKWPKSKFCCLFSLIRFTCFVKQKHKLNPKSLWWIQDFRNCERVTVKILIFWKTKSFSCKVCRKPVHSCYQVANDRKLWNHVGASNNVARFSSFVVQLWSRNDGKLSCFVQHELR